MDSPGLEPDTQACKVSVFPVKLNALESLIFIVFNSKRKVGNTGFEPVTSCASCKYSSQLS